MPKMMFTTFALYLLSLLVVVTATPALYSYEPACVTETLISPQLGFGPTRTVFVSTETKTSSMDCHGCSLLIKTAFPFPDILPSQTTVTADCTTATSYVCASGNGNATRPTTSPVSDIYRRATLNKPKRDVVIPPFTGEAQQLVIQLATAIYIVEVINNDGELKKACDTLNVTVLNLEGLNGALAKQKICEAAQNPPPPATASAIDQVLALATALYAVEVAGHYAGGTNLTNLCKVVDTKAISLLGFDGPAVKNYVCTAALGETKDPACPVGPSATAPASPLNGTTSFNPSETAPASPVNTTLSGKSVVTVHSTVTLHSVITLHGSGTAPASGIDTSSASVTVTDPGPKITDGPVPIPTEGPIPGSGTSDATTATKVWHHYSYRSVKPCWIAGTC